MKYFFLGYPSFSKAYRIFNKRIITIEESTHIAFDENILLPLRKEECIDNDSITLEKKIKKMSRQEKPTLEVEEIANKDHTDLSKDWKYVASHPKDLIIGDPSQGVRTRSSYREEMTT